MNAKTFAKRLCIELTDIERKMLDYLAERVPQKGAHEIAQGIFARGLATIVGEEREKQGRVVEGQRQRAPGLNVRADKIPFSKPKYKKPSPIPDALVVRLDDDLRDRLEELLLTRRDTSIESILESALRVGLDESNKPGGVDPAPVFERLKAKEASGRAAARERRRKMVARLHALAAR